MNSSPFILIFGLCMAICSAQAQDKNWLDYTERQVNYPSKIYFTGFISEYVSKDEDVDAVVESVVMQARGRLSESIQLTIESTIVNKMQNVNSVSLEEFEKISRSYSRIELGGLNTNYHFDRRKKIAFGFAWIKKGEVRSHYQQLLEHKVDEIQKAFDVASVLAKTNRIAGLKGLLELYTTFEELAEIQTILIACGVDDRSTLHKDKTDQIITELNLLVASLKEAKSPDLAGLTAGLAYELRLQLDSIDQPVHLKKVTYRDSGMGSEFSQRFHESMKVALINEGFIVADSVSDLTARGSVILSGHFWETVDNSLEVSLILSKHDLTSGPNTLAGSTGVIPIAYLNDSRLAFKPRNYFAAVEKKELLINKTKEDGGARLEAWTSRGDYGVIFNQGERVRLSVRLNQPGYLRLIYHWADGTKSLLVDNYRIEGRKVNRIIQLPLEWEVTCPCGVEFVQVIARSIEHIPLTVENIQGVLQITQSDVDFMEKSYAENVELLEAGGYVAQKRLTMTTLDW